MRCEALLRRVGLESNWTSGSLPAASAEELRRLNGKFPEYKMLPVKLT